MRRVFLPLLIACLPALAQAAASVQLVTPVNTSVMGGERMVYSARFFDALGRPAAGETVSFANDACGFFDNGAFATSTVTDASGTASAGFTARPQGITCWITVQAGVVARFNVFTYTLGLVSLAGSVYPAEPRPGLPFEFNARAYAGAYPIYGAQVEARVVPASAATISASSGAGEEGRTPYEVTRNGFDAFEIEMTYRGLTRRYAVPAVESPLQDMWWSGQAENGWGMSVVQHGDRLFAAIYAYDADGAPTWYVMPGGTWNAERTVFSGSLYSPLGSPYTDYDASRLSVGAAAGSATLTFSTLGEATLEYSIGGKGGRKALARQAFGLPESFAAPRRVGDMWWGGPSQNGWGIALLQQHRTIFGVWFTYGEDGAPTWFVMPAGFWADDNTWKGRIYRTRGAPWLGQPYDASRLVSTDVGPFTLRFEGEGAAFTYTIGGKTGTMMLVRQAF
jgi:hypothetical protein